MAKLAINIVLLPPKEIMNLAKKINKKLIEKSASDVNFANNLAIPHISLCMGGIKEEDLPLFKNILSSIAEKFSPVQALAKNLSDDYISSTGEFIAGLTITRPDELQKLHEEIVRQCDPLFVNIGVTELHSSANTQASSAEHVNRFVKTDSFENYCPHISLGLGKIGPIHTDLPIKFTAKRLAICHLGNHCTCRQILFETKLKGK